MRRYLLSEETKASIREMIISGNQGELLADLRKLNDPENPKTANEIALATREAFVRLKPDEWTIGHLEKLNIVNQFISKELKIRLDLFLYLFDPVMHNALTLCNEFHKGELSEQKAKYRLAFIRHVKQVFPYEIEKNSVIRDKFNYIETHFDSILSALTSPKDPHKPCNNAENPALRYLHGLIYTCHYGNKRISADVYDGLVLLLNFYRGKYKDIVSERSHSYLRSEWVNPFEKFLSNAGFYIGGNIKNQTELATHLQRRLIDLDDIRSQLPFYEKPREEADQSFLKRIFAKPHEVKKDPFEKLRNYCESLKEKTQWLNTGQIYDITNILFENKGTRDEGCEKVCASVESILDRNKIPVSFLNPEAKDGFKSTGLCYLFYQQKQFTYDIFCGVFCNNLKLGNNASDLWEQLSLKCFKDRAPNEVKLSKETVYAKALGLLPAQEVIALMLMIPLEWCEMERQVTADAILTTIWLDNHFSIFNRNIFETIFYLDISDINENRYNYGYAPKIFHYSAYLLLMLHLDSPKNEKNLNPDLIASFLDSSWREWKKSLYAIIKYTPKETMRLYFSTESKELVSQLGKLIVISKLRCCTKLDVSIERSEPCFDDGYFELCLLSKLSLHQLENVIKVIDAIPIIPEEADYQFILKFTLSLVRSGYPASAIDYYLNLHYLYGDHVISKGARPDGLQVATPRANFENKFRQRFALLTDAKNAIIALLALNSQKNANIPWDVIVLIASHLHPDKSYDSIKPLADKLREREQFRAENRQNFLRSKEGLNKFVSKLDQYPIQAGPKWIFK